MLCREEEAGGIILRAIFLYIPFLYTILPIYIALLGFRYKTSTPFSGIFKKQVKCAGAKYIGTAIFVTLPPFRISITIHGQ